MLVEELKELARSIQEQRAEEQKIEVKAAHIDCPKRLYDTLSSFSNQDTGGILIFGLDEKQDFKAVGVYDLQDLQKKVTEQCNLQFVQFLHLQNMKVSGSFLQKYHPLI